MANFDQIRFDEKQILFLNSSVTIHSVKKVLSLCYGIFGNFPLKLKLLEWFQAVQRQAQLVDGIARPSYCRFLPAELICVVPAGCPCFVLVIILHISCVSYNCEKFARNSSGGARQCAPRRKLPRSTSSVWGAHSLGPARTLAHNDGHGRDENIFSFASSQMEETTEPKPTKRQTDELYTVCYLKATMVTAVWWIRLSGDCCSSGGVRFSFPSCIAAANTAAKSNIGSNTQCNSDLDVGLLV